MFDVDKLYVMIPEFRVSDVDIKSARRDFLKANEGIGKLIDNLTGSSEEIDEREDFREFLRINKDKYKIEPVISKIEYNHSKSPAENTLALRNNLLIDMMWGVLTNSDTASKILNPGGFNNIKKASRIINILLNASKEELERNFKVKGSKNIMLKLADLDLDSLTDISNVYRETMDPLSPVTLVNLQQLNMAGAQMIGIYANHNANHAIAQHTDLALDSDNGGFVLNGRTLLQLNLILAEDKTFISKNTAEYLAASVDNVKDPVLKYLNGNTFTGDAQMLLSRLGYSPLEINLLMTQPIILDMTLAYFRLARLGKGKSGIINEVLKEYSEKGKLLSNLSYDNFKNNKFLIEDLANNILIAKEMEGIRDYHDTDDADKVDFYKNLAAVGYLFSRIMKSAEALADFVATTRSDTLGGAAGPTIADTELKLLRISDFYESANTDVNFPLNGAAVIDPDLVWDGNPEAMREEFMSTQLPYIQAFYTLGVKSSELLLGKYFPLFKNDFRAVIESMRKMTKGNRLDVKTMNSIYNDLFAYALGNTLFFGGDDEVTSYEKREKFINDFPTYFKLVVSSNQDIASLEFIKRLKWLKPNDRNAVPSILFRNVGHLTPALKDRYMRDWGSMLYMGDEAQEFALNLFRYSYFKNGFAFGSDSFMHLAPTILRKAVPGYIDYLRSINQNDDSYHLFIDLYIYNHPDNRKLVPEIPQDTTIEFFKDKEPLDEVTVVINDNSTISDRKVTINQEKLDLNTTKYKFADYITIRLGNDFIYYRRLDDDTTTDNSAIYHRFVPFGTKRGFLQYEYGVFAEDMELAIKENPKYSGLVALLVQSDADISEEGDSKMSDEDIRDAYADDVFSQAMEQVYGRGFANEVKPDIMNETPLENYRDADNNPLCK